MLTYIFTYEDGYVGYESFRSEKDLYCFLKKNKDGVPIKTYEPEDGVGFVD